MTAPLWKRIIVDGAVTIVAGRTGSGSDPIIAIHGLTGDHHWFDAVASEIHHRGGLLAPDLRGRGASAKPLLGYGLHEHARDIVRMLDQQGIQRATLVGHSMGAYVALATALRYPDRVSGIVLIDGGWPRPRFPLLASNTPALLNGIAAALVRVALLSPRKLNAARQDAWWVSVAAPTARDLRQIHCPVALIRAGDGFTPGSSPVIDSNTLRDIMGCINLALDAVLPGANHYTMLEDPRFARRVAAEIDRFKREIAAPARRTPPTIT